ncbi:MAG: GNAT family N-acetyltransferase, partial [Solimonas sp.]
VAEFDEPRAVIGALITLTRANSTVARIYSVVVAPSARGLGLGRRLVGQAERGARRHGCTTISLEVRADNRAARALYAGLGYAEQARLPRYYDDGGDGLRLRKAL